MTWQGSGPSTQAATLACPRCGGVDARTLRVIHESGTSTSRGTATGWTLASGSKPGHLTTFTTSSTRQTAAAKAAAPPRKRRNGLAFVGFGIFLALFAGIYGFSISIHLQGSDAAVAATIAGIGLAAGVALLVVGIVLAPRNHRYNSEEFRAEFRQWERTWACQRCGTHFAA